MSCPWRRLLTAFVPLLACGALAGSLSGCGSASGTIDPVAQAAEVSSAAGGVEMAFNASITAPGLTSPVTMTGGGAFSYIKREGKLNMEMTGLPASATAALGGGTFHIEELFKGDELYMSSPLFTGHLPNNARWMKLDLGKLGLSGLASGESNPAQFLEYLRSDGGSVSKVGTETLEGVSTTRYRGAIKLSAVTKKLPSSLRGAFEKGLAETGLTSIPFEVWVDSQHRVRQIAMNMSMDVSGQRAGMQMTIGLSHYGAALAPVTAPAASEVAELPASPTGF